MSILGLEKGPDPKSHLRSEADYLEYLIWYLEEGRRKKEERRRKKEEGKLNLLVK